MYKKNYYARIQNMALTERPCRLVLGDQLVLIWWSRNHANNIVGITTTKLSLACVNLNDDDNDMIDYFNVACGSFMMLYLQFFSSPFKMFIPIVMKIPERRI